MPITSMMSECKPDIQDITAHVKNLMLELSDLGLVHISNHYTIWCAAWIPDSTDEHNRKHGNKLFYFVHLQRQSTFCIVAAMKVLLLLLGGEKEGERREQITNTEAQEEQQGSWKEGAALPLRKKK
jgi:hypothetical protein